VEGCDKLDDGLDRGIGSSLDERRARFDRLDQECS
jgi:hypothetical protein